MSAIQLSRAEARKIILNAQWLNPLPLNQQKGDSTLAVITQLSYVQIDSISVIQRAHHHTLWNRDLHYHPQALDNLLAEKKIFEYWSHAAAYLAMKDYRFSLRRKLAVAQGEKHWFEKNKKLSIEVLKVIRDNGPLRAKDFEQTNNRSTGWWDWKPAKRALEQLFIEGELMVVKRQGFQKVYDLTERVLPKNIDTTLPTDNEYLEFLIQQYLKANGIGTVAQMGYLRKGMNSLIKSHCQSMLHNEQLIEVEIEGLKYLALPDVTESLNHELDQTSVKILSPFDNLVIQRKRLAELFDYHYQLECYLSASKRQFGYFSLPILWHDKFVARLDVKREQKTGLLRLVHLCIEAKINQSIIPQLKLSLRSFAQFNECQHIQLEKISNTQKIYSRATISQFKKSLSL